MEEPSVSRSEPEIKESPITDNPKEFLESGGDASQYGRILSVDRLTIEKIVLENAGSREILLTKSESSRKLSERTTRLPTAKSRSSLWRRRASSTDELPTSRSQRLKLVNNGILIDPNKSSSLSTCDQKTGSATSLNKRISPIRLTKSSSIGSLVRFNRIGKSTSSGKIRKIPPKVPAKPLKKKHPDIPYFGPVVTLESPKKSTTESRNKVSDCANLVTVDNPAEDRKSLEKNQSEIGRFRENLRKKINSGAGTCERNSGGLIDRSVEPYVEISDPVSALETEAHERLEKSQSEIERLQQNLRTKINASTAETYKQKLPGLHVSPVKILPIADLDLNENVTETPFDKKFLERHSLDTSLKIEEKRLLETDIDYFSDSEKNSDCGKLEKPKYSKTVSEIERRWSGEFLENNYQQNSSESSYVEELGSVSSRESVNCEASNKFYNGIFPQKSERQIEDCRKQQGNEEVLEDTVSTVDSDSCVEDRIKAIDDDIDKATEVERGEEERSNVDDTNGNFLKRSSPETCFSENLERRLTVEKSETDFQHIQEKSIDLEKYGLESQRSEYVVIDREVENDQLDSVKRTASPDGYASLIQEFTMEAGSSKYNKEEKKKRSGLRRLLPGIFSPRDSRKEYKKEQKERKKRDEKHFNQHQQNGIYTRSPDTMNLNEDITRNVKLDTSLNGSIIEERLNEIKQELFADQGMTTSTPDHFLQGERTIGQDVRSPRSFTVNSSLSSIAPDEKWLDHNIISGSPDMRKFKQQMRNENERKCSLERKHSLQESAQPRFMRNHGASGRISAPPGERFLIRPRAVHPVDRPLPAIPQKIEFSNYQNHEEIMKHPSYFGTVERPEALTNYQADSYFHMNSNRNYENGNHVKGKTEINRNQGIDSEFNLTPVSAQVKITRQLIVNQNQKAPLIGRSPKYSPSSSQKSGDYADSSYTPNSSQKSEFSPGSSKSGEYYLNSPRNSCRTSPDESFTDRRDQQPSHSNHRSRINEDQEASTHSVPYPVSPKIRVQSKDDRYYDGASVSPEQESRLDKLVPNSRHSVGQGNSPQEAIYVTQRGSANIPMSSNLAKLRANVENTTTSADGAINVDCSFGDKPFAKDGSRITSPDASFGILASPVQFRDSSPQKEDKEPRPANLSPLRATTPSRMQRIASPLTIVTPGSPSEISSSVTSPNQSQVTDRSLSPTNSRLMTSPRNLVQTSSPQNVQRRSGNQSSQARPPVSSPNINQSRMTPSSGPYSPMSTFNSRRAQPSDQILIASPKRDASIYGARTDRSLSKMESDCPDSPVPMAESPSQVSVPRSQTSRRNAVDRTKSPISDVSGSEELLKEFGDGKQSQVSQRASSIVREIRPLTDGKNIQRPEPIYVKQPVTQRVMSPLLIHSDSKTDNSPVGFSGESRQDSLLVSVRQEIGTPNRTTLNPRKLLQDIDEASQQSVNENPGQRETIFVERRVQSPSGTARAHPQRPEVIYVQRQQNLSPEIMKELDSSVSSRQSGGRQRDKEFNRSLEHVQMDPGCEIQTNESIYAYRKPDRFRDSPNEQIYGMRNSQQSLIPVSVGSPSSSYRRQDVGVEPNSGQVVAKLSDQQQQQQIYATRRGVVADTQQQVSPASRQSATKDPTCTQRQSPKDQEPIYTQRSSEPIYGQRSSRQLSPSKRQMMQHLEAFYWQQKALDSQRKSMNSPTLTCRGVTDGKIDSPEVREAIYWQQLKKLDEEQQRRIFEENQMEEKGDPLYWRKKVQGSLSPSHPVNPTRHGSAPSLASQNLTLVPVNQNQQHPDNSEQIYWQNKMQQGKSQIPVGKPPVMGQKCQNQPVLVVRPQQAVREMNRTNRSPVYDRQDGGFVGQDKLRSKSVSPHFTRGDERRSLSLPRKPDVLSDEVTGSGKSSREAGGASIIARKTATPSIYEEHDLDGKKPLAPPPIFKRGSLISNSSSSVEYGTMGPKRVSFSNQPNSPEVGAGNWPTKHGMAPEPPTRKHRTEERSSETIDSVFLCNQENQNSNNIYGNVVNCAIDRNAQMTQISPLNEQRNIVYETEYDAKPLPPPPRASSWMLKRSSSMKDNSCNNGRIPRIEIQRAKVPANQRKWPGVSESESGSEAGEVQRILHLRNEEEWNPGGKGRQSNDTGGSGRAEGEGGSNDLAGGRRGGVGILGGGRGSSTSGSGGGGAGGRSRDEPRRHTLSGDHQPSLHHQQFNTQQLHPLHPHHLPPLHGQYGTPPTRHTTMDLEMGTKSRQRKSPLPRGYPPPSSTMLFDDDPGIMSEVETSSTGFRRGGKQRSSLPVVRTPSKTLERPLGLVFLQYRNETKRALLPNEITSIDTVKALFVRSFPKQLTMEYLDSPHVKVYIHDSNKDMFYELEDLRSHLRDIRDRSVLRLFESTDGVAGMPGPMGGPAGGAGLPPHWEDQSYFSEPEFDSEFQHQHIHKSKTAKNSSSGSSGYYVGGSSTLPRGGPLMRAYSPAASTVVAGPNATPTQPKGLSTPGGGGVAPAKPLRSYQCGKSPLGSLGGSARFSRDSSVSLYSIPDRLHGESGYMSSPERGGGAGTGSGRYPGAPYSTGSSYEEPYYSQYSGTVTPVIDEEASDTELLEESYSLYGVKPPGRPPSGPPRSPFPPGAPALPPGQPYDVTRIRVEQMERQLANLTGLVQKALTHPSHTSPSPRDYLQVPAGRDPYTRTTGAGDEFDKHSSSSSASLPDDSYLRTDVKPPKLGKDKSVSFEKSVSFSDEPPDMNSPKQHSPQHAADTKPTKPAIKSSTLPRMSSQERDRHKPTPPPKPVALAAGQYVYRDLALTPEMYNQLRGLQKKAKDLRQEVRNLRRMSQAQAHTVRETIRDTFITIRAMLLSGGDAAWAAGDTEKMRLSREEDLYKQEMIRLEKDLTELESTVEELRGNVINRKTRVNMSDVENMALILSKSSKTVADLKVRFPSLQEGMKGLLSSEMEKVVREEKFLNEEPERLESALRRCKKLTGTLVTLKRLASVQEQRSPNAASVDAEETPPITPTSAQHSKTTAPVPAERTVVGSASIIGGGSHVVESSAPHQQRPENALDALLDELQTFSRPASQMSQASGAGPPSNHMPNLLEIGRSVSQIVQSSGRAPCMSDIGRKGSIDSSTSLAIMTPGHSNTLRRLHSYPSSSDTDTSPPIARLQVSDGSGTGTGTGPAPQKPPVPERNAELLQLATARRVPPPPPPRTSSRSPLASPTSPQLPPRNPTGTLRRGRASAKEGGKPPMALPANAVSGDEQIPPNNMLSTSNSSSCESINSQEGLQNKKGRQEQLEQRHQELLRKQKALQEQYARLQQLQRNASGLTTVPPAPPDLLKKTGSESNLLAKMGLGLSTTTSGSLTSLAAKPNADGQQSQPQADLQNAQSNVAVNQTTTSKIYETDIL